MWLGSEGWSANHSSPKFPSFEMSVQKTTFVAATNSDLLCRLGLDCMIYCVSRSCLLSAQPVSTSNAEAWKRIKLHLALNCHPKKPFLAPHHQCIWWMLHLLCQSKQCWSKSPIIPFGPKHIQSLITSLNITAWSKWKPSHKVLIQTAWS